MALVQIDRGAIPRRYGVKTTQYQYTERGQRRTLHYVYTETDTSISPLTSYKPTTNMQQVCGAGDPTRFPMYTNGGIYPVEWQITTAVRTFNSDTSYEFSLTIITSCRAICNGSDIGGWNFGSNSSITEHFPGKDYHDSTGRGQSVSILDSAGQPTTECYINGERVTTNGLHGFFYRAVLETVYDTPTSSHIEYRGVEEVEMRAAGLSGYPVTVADAITVKPYTCSLSLSYNT